MASPDLLFLMLNDNGDGLGSPAGNRHKNAGARRRSRHITKKFRRLD